MEEQAYAQFAKWLFSAKRAVFFGGAGVSTESGIPDFRSTDGLYHTKWADPPETIISHDYFVQFPEKFYDFYRKKLLYPDAVPNDAHRVLSLLEQEGHLAALVTQNIDGLHQAAGSKTVYELHGSVLRNSCTRCGRHYGLSAVLGTENLPRCPACGGLIKPDVVLYGEGLDNAVVSAAIDAIEKADLLIIGGTGLGVYPAAGLIRFYQGHPLVLINKTPTPQDGAADLLFRAPIGQVLKKTYDLMHATEHQS